MRRVVAAREAAANGTLPPQITPGPHPIDASMGAKRGDNYRRERGEDEKSEEFSGPAPHYVDPPPQNRRWLSWPSGGCCIVS